MSSSGYSCLDPKGLQHVTQSLSSDSIHSSFRALFSQRLAYFLSLDSPGTFKPNKFLLSLAIVLSLFDTALFAQPSLNYSVQILISAKPISTNGPLFSNLPAVHEERLDTGYAYVTAPGSDLAQSISLQKEIKSKGFKNAVVVAYKKGKRVPFNLSLAEKLLSPAIPTSGTDPESVQSETEYSSPVFIFIR